MRVNGENKTLSAPMSLGNFLEENGYALQRIVVERNREIITREQFFDVILDDEDTLEIVHFVGGG